MRKFILPLCLFFLAITASAQQFSITANSGKSYKTFPGIDYVFMFNGITAATEITYNGTGTTINWYKFTDKTTPVSNQSTFLPDGDTGYTLNVDGKNVATIWVVDYNAYLPKLNNIDYEKNPAIQCHDVNLLMDIQVPALNYQTSDGNSHTISRDFNITYNTLTWGGSAWQQKDTTVVITLPGINQKTVPAPYCNTTFTLSGDQYASGLNMPPVSTVSSSYTAVAVICHETAVISTRDAKNENERPENQVYVSNSAELSAPMEMQFLSNPNEPVQYYKWEIFKDNKSIVTRTDKDIRYTFTEYGTYKVAVTVSNANACSYTDSIIVTVSESQLKAPNVFTPNGDGHNDEFRVAYKSITSFHCWIYNRWGRLVYEWSDPMKGWDGNIGGKKASPGAYFYIIKALGSDYNPASKPNPKTKRRVGEYYLKGDINLLRGAGN